LLLNQSIPLLFATPSAASSRRGIVFSLLILSFAIIVYIGSESLESVPFFFIITILIGLHGYICLITTGSNLLYIFRYFLVWILIFATALIWFLYNGEIVVAPFGLKYQTIENTRLLILAGICSLCGSLIGWHFVLLRYKYRQNIDFIISIKKQKISLRNAGVFLSVSSALLFVWKSGGIVGSEKTYADGQLGFTLAVNVFNIFHFIGISLLLLAGIKENRIEVRNIFFAILTLVPGMLTGSRADYLPQAFIVFILVFNSQIMYAFTKRQYMKIVKLILIVTLLLIIAYLIASFIALWRIGIDPMQALNMIFKSDNGFFINTNYGHKLLWLETGNHMLGGLYSAIIKVDQGFLFGKSYFDYILILPPAFLDLPRPLGLEWLTDINGETMTQGGIFEVAEAYWNFGLIGCFFVSFIISYVFGWLLQRGLKGNNYFYLVWYMVYGLHSFRSVWYQNFAYVRLMTVMLVVYFVGLFLFRWFIFDRNTKNEFGRSVILDKLREENLRQPT